MKNHAHRRVKGGRRGTSCTPSKDFKKLNYKNAINHKIGEPPPRFYDNPQYPPQRNLKMTSMFILKTYRYK
jgi:hypothetical protein